MTPHEDLTTAWLASAVAFVRLDEPALPSDAVFEAIVDACAPFRRGMRYSVVPAVTLDTERGRVPDVSDLVPKHGENLDGYLSSMSERGEGWALTVTEPLFDHYALWALLRKRLSALWMEVGHPIMPVGTEVILADGHGVLPVAPVDETTMYFGLSGSTVIEIGDDAHPLDAGAVLVAPAGTRPRLASAAASMVARVRVLARGSAPIVELVDVLAANADALGDGAVAYRPWDDSDGELPGLLDTEPVLLAEEVADASVLERWQAVQWLGRVSSAGLEPPPSPREPEALDDDDVLALVTDVHIIPEPNSDRSLWGVNGQVFTVTGTIPGTVLDRLRAKPTATVEELCSYADGEDNGALPLLYRLYVIRAIDLVERRNA
ncbi:hypothetical protein [Stackebrandtia soli]|uniref:hypothetical protein n=1 Tax=Stackebrandtia soli TaxID=1892856 RepID=UPI0039EA4F6C